MKTNLLLGTDLNHDFIGFDEVYDHCCCLAKVMSNGKYGFVGFDFEYRIEPIFDYAECFCDGFALVVIDGKFGFVKKDGKYLVKPLFDHAKCFCNNVAEVRINDKVRFLKKNGKFQSKLERRFFIILKKVGHFYARLLLYPYLLYD